MPKKETGFRGIALKKGLVDSVRKLIRRPNSGYKSVSGFVADAVKQRMKELRQIYVLPAYVPEIRKERKTGPIKTFYKTFRVCIPKAIATDPQFPFKKDDTLSFKIDGAKLILEKLKKEKKT